MRAMSGAYSLSLRKFGALKVGHPFDETADIGALIHEEHARRVENYIEIGRQEGAEVLLGGTRLAGDAFDGGCFVAPTVLDRVGRVPVGVQLVGRRGQDVLRRRVLRDVRALPEGHAAVPDRSEVGTATAEEAFGDLVDRLESGSGGRSHLWLETGIRDLDDLTDGLRPGELVVLASRPGVGKSSLGLNMIRSCALAQGRRAALFTLESSRADIIERITSAEARVPAYHIRTRQVAADGWSRIAQAAERIVNAPLHIDDRARLTTAALQAACRRLQERHGSLDLVVVDYVQLITPSSPNSDSRYAEVAQISRDLKRMAKELWVPVVAISQLNRVPEQRRDRMPELWDLRDSGTLEDDADMVILVHRPDAYDLESPRAGEADLRVAKSRHTPGATVTVAYQGHYARFVDMVHEAAEQEA
jgi:replicative DNA helicase